MSSVKKVICVVSGKGGVLVTSLLAIKSSTNIDIMSINLLPEK